MIDGKTYLALQTIEYARIYANQSRQYTAPDLLVIQSDFEGLKKKVQTSYGIRKKESYKEAYNNIIKQSANNVLYQFDNQDKYRRCA